VPHVRRHVRVEVDEGVTPGVPERGVQRAAAAEALVAVEVPDAVVAGRQPVGDGRRLVVAAVLRDHHLEAPRREEAVEGAERGLDRRLDGVGLVVRGEDDAHLDGRIAHWNHCSLARCKFLRSPPLSVRDQQTVRRLPRGVTVPTATGRDDS